MTETAKIGQHIQSKLHPMVQLPILYNYNQNRSLAQNFRQSEFQFDPIIPIIRSEGRALFLNPMFEELVTTQNQQTSKQFVPVQLATYFASKTYDILHGLGPFIQMPTANPSSGSQQTGVGFSYGLFYEPKHWVIGGTGYNAWGIGTNRSAGTANLYNVNSIVSYTTDNAWTYNLQSWINGNPTNGRSGNTNQLLFTVGKTVKMTRSHMQCQIGPTYMVTDTPTSPRGWGGFISLTFAIME